MWRILLIIIVLSPTVNAVPHIYYASTAGSGTSCNDNISAPCKVRDLLDTTILVTAGSTIYLRGGTYPAKLIASLSGAAGNNIIIKNYPGEFAVLDGYITTTLNGNISNSTTSIALADGTNFPNGFVIILHDGTEGSEEQILLGGKSGNTYNSCTRAWGGTAAVSHTTGATTILGGDQIYISGSYLTFQNLIITNSDPTRIQTPANAQNGPHIRGEGFFNLGDNNKFINCVIHDVQDGFFNSQSASGTEVYGCLFYNNGYVANGAYNGHGLYLIHEDVNATAYIKENIVFNNSNIGIKGDSQNGSTINVFNEGNISFNSGRWLNSNFGTRNILMSTNNGSASGITIKDNFFYYPAGVNATCVSVDLGGGDLTMTGNYIANGVAVGIQNSKPITFTGNTIRATNNTGGGNSTVILHTLATSPITTWNNNNYSNSITSGLGYYYAGSDSISFAQFKLSSGFDAATTETLSAPVSNWQSIRANAYDSTQANVTIYNWTAGTTATINVSGIFPNGTSVAVFAVEEGTFPNGMPTTTVTVSGGNIIIPMDGTTVAAQIGANGTSIVAPVTMRPTFEAFRLVGSSIPTVCNWSTSPACN